MEHGHRALEARIGQIRIELRQVLRHHHALEDDGAGRETRHVEHGSPAKAFSVRRRAMNKRPVERRLVDILGPGFHEQLLDERQRPQRLLATGARVYRHHSPAGGLQAPAARAPRRAPRGPPRRAARRATETPAPRRSADRARCRPPRPPRAEGFRLFSQQAATVAGLAVGGDRAAMREAIEGGHGGAHSQWLGASSRLAIRPNPQLSRSYAS